MENRNTTSLSPQFANNMQGLPQVTLDTTLEELYARDSGKADKSRIAMVPCAAHAEIAPTSRLARNTKYLYQDSTFSANPKITSLQQDKDVQRSVAVKYLSRVPQCDTFAAGRMPLVFFNVDDSEGNTVRSKQVIEETILSLITIQRPTLFFLS